MVEWSGKVKIGTAISLAVDEAYEAVFSLTCLGEDLNLYFYGAGCMKISSGSV